MNRRSLLRSIGALALGMAACKKSAPAAGSAPLKLQLNWLPEPEFGGYYAARFGGAFHRAGLEVDIVGGGPGSPVVQLVASGQADFGVIGASDVLIARERGADIVALFAAFAHSPQGIMVRKSRGIERLEDLKDGTLALEPGLPFAKWAQKKYGFAGVTVVPYDGGVAKYLTDDHHAQQCFLTSEPLAAKKKGIESRVFSAAEIGFDPYEACLVTSGKLLAERGAVATAIVGAVREGWTSYLRDPKSTNLEMRKLNTAMDDETFAAAAEAQRDLIGAPGAALGAMAADRWQRLGEQLVELGVIKKAAPPTDCFRAL
jgi:NitT/TauT family transport system substrate-binding protein